MANHDQLFDRSAKKRHFIAGFSNDLMDIGHPVPICSNFEIHTKGSIIYISYTNRSLESGGCKVLEDYVEISLAEEATPLIRGTNQKQGIDCQK